MIVRPSEWSFWNRTRTSKLVRVSRLPVASSARITAGSFTKALAIATLCICPPDIWLLLCSNLSPRPTAFNASTERSNLSFLEYLWLYISGSSTFSMAVVFASRL